MYRSCSDSGFWNASPIAAAAGVLIHAFPYQHHQVPGWARLVANVFAADAQTPEELPVSRRALTAACALNPLAPLIRLSDRKHEYSERLHPDTPSRLTTKPEPEPNRCRSRTLRRPADHLSLTCPAGPDAAPLRRLSCAGRRDRDIAALHGYLADPARRPGAPLPATLDHGRLGHLTPGSPWEAGGRLTPRAFNAAKLAGYSVGAPRRRWTPTRACPVLAHDDAR